MVFAKENQSPKHSPSSNNDDSNAHFLIEGSVRVNDNLTKITVKLIDTQKHEHVWGETFEYDLDSIAIVDLQEIISAEVAKVIAGEYGIILQTLSEESSRKNISNVETYDAILRFYNYEYSLSREAAQNAMISLEKAISNDPNCGILYSMLASIYGAGYMLDRPGAEAILSQIITFAKKGIDLMPNNQITTIVYAWSFFVQNNKDMFLKYIATALRLNPKSPLRIGNIGFFLALYGDWEEGIKLLRQAMELNSGFPKTFHGVTTLYYYRQDEFEKAYNEVLKYEMQGLFWPPLLRAACQGKLGKIKESKKSFAQLIKLRPDFPKKSRYLISLYVKENDLVEGILDGLKIAGCLIP